VLEVILNRSITERIKQWQGLQADIGRVRIVLSSETLALCHPGGRRCIPPDAVEIARSHVAPDSYPRALAESFEKSVMPQQLIPITTGLLTTVGHLQDLPVQGPYAMAVSKPVYVANRSLVYVQFGHGYNNYSFLAILTQSPGGEWTLTKELLVSVGD
jgi:hypothetical protein